ncbi:hypothetical protein RBSH_06139 [Rhodopirellula baltica SH28]|uniref:Uncharacterized protein n=1 Tax=Rhodopirellula baltica SH28 TaxID=993517 RepID=K5DYM6_RHOBT|nr:hypothetical protein RBSH_06139 [Rhodopirellula baltica SH28]
MSSNLVLMTVFVISIGGIEATGLLNRKDATSGSFVLRRTKGTRLFRRR